MIQSNLNNEPHANNSCLDQHPDISPISFQDVFPGPVGEAIDGYFKERGWELQIWYTDTDSGYQVYFGAGVQVDNLYEYGFPYLLQQDELLAFALGFYTTHFIARDVEEYKITDSARISVTWDSFGIAVDLNYSYDEREGYGESVLCYCEPYADGMPDQAAWAEAISVGQLLKEKYDLPVIIEKDEVFLRENGTSQVEVLDSYESNNSVFFTVSLEPGFCADVKICTDTGLAYVMQNDDGSLVYAQGDPDRTYPDYPIDEQAVLRLVKAFHSKNVTANKPALSSRIESAASRVVESGSPETSLANDHTVER